MLNTYSECDYKSRPELKNRRLNEKVFDHINM
jgi:hypothetical protein